MNFKTWLLLLVALVAGGAAALGVKSIFFVESDEAPEGPVVAGIETPILVANVDLPAGSELTAQNVRLTLASESEIPREPTLSFSDAVGEVTTRDLKAGEPISLFDVAVAEESETLESSYIKPGYSIVPIEIQTATKAGGGRDFLKSTKLDKMLKPGDVVDLAVVKEDKSAATTQTTGHARRRLTTETIVEGAEVFSVSDSSRFSQETGAAERVSTVCVQLSEEQLAAALKAAEQGRVKIVPRVEEADFSGDADAPLALDGNLGGAFEPPMNADFSFSGLTEETTGAASDWEIVAAETTSEPTAVETEPTDLAQDQAAETTDALVPFEIAVEDETPEIAPEAELLPESDPAADALVPFEIAVEDETPEAASEAENEPEQGTPFRLRNASVRSETAADDENEDEEAEESADETPNDAAAPVAPVAPVAEPRQANVAPSPNAPTYRESAVETSVADEASAEAAPSAAAKNFKYVSPFVTVNKKKASTNAAPNGRWGATAR